MVTEDQAHRIEGDEAGHVIHGEDEVPVEDFAKGRVLAVLKDLLDTGVLTELPGEGEARRATCGMPWRRQCPEVSLLSEKDGGGVIGRRGSMAMWSIWGS